MKFDDHYDRYLEYLIEDFPKNDYVKKAKQVKEEKADKLIENLVGVVIGLVIFILFWLLLMFTDWVTTLF